MKPKSHQAVFFKTESAEHYCISPSLALYKRVLHKKTLNFQGIHTVLCSLSLPKRGVKPRACTWPRQIWAKRNHILSSWTSCAATAGKHQHHPIKKLQSLEGYPECCMPWAATGRQPSNMTSLCPAPSGEERSENSGNVAVFPYLSSVQQNWTWLKKKIREYWKQTTWLNQTKISQQLQKRGELRITACITEVTYLNTFL